MIYFPSHFYKKDDFGKKYKIVRVTFEMAIFKMTPANRAIRGEEKSPKRIIFSLLIAFKKILEKQKSHFSEVIGTSQRRKRYIVRLNWISGSPILFYSSSSLRE